MKKSKYDDIPPIDIVDTQKYGQKEGEYESRIHHIETLIGPQDDDKLDEINQMLS